jgi:hypothetical protein
MRARSSASCCSRNWIFVTVTTSESEDVDDDDDNDRDDAAEKEGRPPGSATLRSRSFSLYVSTASARYATACRPEYLSV